MESNSLLTDLQSIFRDILDRPDLILTRDSNAQTVEDWDSLAHINLVTAVERKYRIKFALSDLQKLKNIGDMLDMIQDKLAAK